MKICIIAFDNKAEVAAELCQIFCGALCRQDVFATGTVSKYIEETAGFHVKELLGVNAGGVEQVSQLVACRDADLVICLRDAFVDSPEVNELIRACDFYGVPVATGLSTAKILLSALSRKNTAEMFGK